MTWFQALKQWNESRKKIDASHVWAIPRRGTPEHAAVHEIMRKAKEPARKPEAPGKSKGKKRYPAFQEGTKTFEDAVKIKMRRDGMSEEEAREFVRNVMV